LNRPEKRSYPTDSARLIGVVEAEGAFVGGAAGGVA